MPALTRKTACAATIVTGIFAVVTTFTAPAYATGAESTAAKTPFKGRTEGGNLELKNGDVVACAGFRRVQVIDTQGTIHNADKPGTKFTTPGGTKVKTQQNKSVKVTLQGASAVVKCPKNRIPITNAFVPKRVLGGSGGGVSGMNTAETVAGGALAAAGIAGGVIVLRRRSVGSRV